MASAQWSYAGCWRLKVSTLSSGCEVYELQFQPASQKCAHWYNSGTTVME